MKKTYEKPRLMALSLSGNDQLCGTCADNNGQLLYKDPTGTIAKGIDILVGNRDGKLTKAETSNIFGFKEDCHSPVENYCKFTSTGNIVAWS